jgi:hypothetical protein
MRGGTALPACLHDSELQAAFHDAAGGAGIDATTKAQHLGEMLELFTARFRLALGAGSTHVMVPSREH